MKRNTIMIRFIKPVLVILAIVFFMACSKSDETPTNPNDLTETDYKVFRVALPSIGSNILVYDSVGLPSELPVLEAYGIDSTVVKQHHERNTEICLFKANWVNILVVSDADIKAQGGLSGLLREHEASSFIRLSKPVYFKTNTMAAFTLDFEYKMSMSGSDVVIAEKKEGEWVLNDIIKLWISK